MRRNRLPALIFLLVGVIALPASAITPHEYLEQGQWSEAVSAYNKVLKEIPDDPIALNNRGFAKHRLGKYKSAISDYDKALKLKPGWYIALNNRGRAYRHLKEFKKAQADFESAIRAMPKSVHGWNNRGRTWADMGKKHSLRLRNKLPVHQIRASGGGGRFGFQTVRKGAGASIYQ